MKRFIALITAIVLVLPCIYIARGEENSINSKIIYSTDPVSGEISLNLSIRGTAPAGLEGKRVTLSILRPNADVDSTDPLINKYATFAQTVIDKNLNYEFFLLMREAEGSYTLRVSIPPYENILTACVDIPSVDVLNDFLSNIINKNYNSEALKNAILNDYRSLGIDIEIFKDLPDYKKLQICNEILNGEFANIVDIVNSFEQNTAVIGFSNLTDLAKMKKIIDMYSNDYYRFSENEIYNLFSAYNQRDKDDVISKLLNKEYSDLDSIRKEFYDNVLLKEFKSVNNYLEIKNILYANRTYLNISKFQNFDNYTTEKQNKILKYVAERVKSFNTLNDFKNTFTYAVDNVNDIEPPTNTGKPSTVGGGGAPRSGGGTVSVDYSSFKDIGLLEDKGNVFEENEDEDEPDTNYEGANVFKDLGNVSWAREAIFYLYDRNIIRGKEDGKFYPNDNITRAEFAKILVESFNLLLDNAECNFKDVNVNDWHYKYIASGYSRGLINGLSNGEFGVNENISREDICTLIYRVMTYKDFLLDITDISNNFSDFQYISYYAKNSVQMLSTYGVIKGFSDGAFRPQQKTTRAEAAQIIYNVLNMKEIKSLLTVTEDETKGLLDVGNVLATVQRTKRISADWDKAEIADINSDTLYRMGVRNADVSAEGAGAATQTLYLTFDISDIKTANKAYLSIRGVSGAKAGFTMPNDLKLCAYKYDENYKKRFATDKSFMGDMLDSKVINVDVVAELINDYKDYRFDVSEYVKERVEAGAKEVTICLSFDYNQIGEYQKKLASGKADFTQTDLSINIVVNTQATRQYDGTEIIYGNGQPKLSIYE